MNWVINESHSTILFLGNKFLNRVVYLSKVDEHLCLSSYNDCNSFLIFYNLLYYAVSPANRYMRRNAVSPINECNEKNI